VLSRGAFVVTLFHIFFPDCLTLSLQRDEHRYDDLNSADPGDIPEDIRELVQGMTQMEEMLCALASPWPIQNAWECYHVFTGFV
jgi:hypothetical protein